MGRQEDDPRVRLPVQNSLGGAHAGGRGFHFDVHQRHVERNVLRHAHKLRAAGRHAHDPHIRLRVERLAQVTAKQFKIIGDQNANDHMPSPFPARRNAAA